MALILNIDTSTNKAGIALGDNGRLKMLTENPEQKDHAAWLHVGIRQLLEDQGLSLRALDAVAVTIGPGSYTGLRVSLAAAKGICYALGIPLITGNTLRMMAIAGQYYGKEKDLADLLVCPMIDARRMEVFSAVYNMNLEELEVPAPKILEPGSYQDRLADSNILFFGSGAKKFSEICNHPNAIFDHVDFNAGMMVAHSEAKFQNSDFTDLAYSEPQYLKEFYNPKTN